MAKKKSFNIETDITCLFSAREWAQMKRIEPVLFVAFGNELISEDDFDKIAKEQTGQIPIKVNMKGE